MKKLFSTIFLAVCMMITLAACSSETGYTYTVDTGENVHISVPTDAGYNISANVPFTITKDGEEIFQGEFENVFEFNYAEKIYDLIGENKQNNNTSIDTSTHGDLDDIKIASDGSVSFGSTENNTDQMSSWSTEKKDGENYLKATIGGKSVWMREGENDGNTYYFVMTHEDCQYIIKIADTDAILVLSGTDIDEDTAQEAFEAISISLEESDA